jgi:hypothetical protein
VTRSQKCTFFYLHLPTTFFISSNPWLLFGTHRLPSHHHRGEIWQRCYTNQHTALCANEWLYLHSSKACAGPPRKCCPSGLDVNDCYNSLSLLIAKRTVQTVWNSHDGSRAFWSQICALAARTYDCSEVSSTHQWSVQSNWVAIKAVQPATKDGLAAWLIILFSR